MSIADPYSQEAARQWTIHDAAEWADAPDLEADVIIIGSGAGGGTTAEILANAGLRVLVVEEGRLHTSAHFRMREDEAYPALYQEGMARTTADGAIAIMQGRTVGGSTTVNWTSSFRTPARTLQYWEQVLGIPEVSVEALAPWFADREARLGIEPWAAPANANNEVLRRGCEHLGWHWQVIPRNVRGCWNLGYCGMGCPTNAKQSMLVTTIPGALSRGAVLCHSLRADRLVWKGRRVEALEASALDAGGRPTGVTVRLKARHFVVAASALGSPALLLRSEVPDPYDRIGRRSFLHPVNATVAEMPERIDPFHGAPQSIYTDHFVWREEGMGYKLEVPPLHPGLSASVLTLHGRPLIDNMARLPWLNAVLALMRDGFHEDSVGGRVRLRDDGSPVLDYPLNDYLWEGLRHAYRSMAEVQFAAGASQVRLLHLDSPVFTRWSDARAAIDALPMRPHRVRLFSAHQMGGCVMGREPSDSVVDAFGRFHHLDNLSIHDASVFPTSLGANPQLSIYGLSARNASRLAEQLGRGVA